MSAPQDDKSERRRKLIGRAIIVLFGLLLAAYIIADVTYRMQVSHR